MSESRVAVLDARGILAVAGPDRAAFLQGLVSNDTARVSGERALYAALLTAQGKYLHDFIMVEVGEAIWLDCEAARLADLKRRLSMYRLRAKVTLDERPDLAVAAVFGGAPLGLPDEPGSARPFGDGVALVDPRLGALGARVILPRERIRAELTEAGAQRDRLRRIRPAAPVAGYTRRQPRPGARQIDPARSRVSTSSTASTGTKAAISARS